MKPNYRLAPCCDTCRHRRKLSQWGGDDWEWFCGKDAEESPDFDYSQEITAELVQEFEKQWDTWTADRDVRPGGICDEFEERT